ncbi:5472_t:CDS:2, partial [Scutellospora calospora]
MSPDQIEQWLKFGDIILNDNTAATNHYEMALSLFLIVDNYLSSYLVAQTLTNDETKKVHTCILQQIKKATFEAAPHVIFTDADPALIAAIRDKFLTTHTLHCIFHIAQNLLLNLKNILRDHYDEFIKDFFEVQQTKAFVLKLFTARMSSTSQIESYNAKIKRLIFNSNITLLELAEKLSVYILEENKKTEYALFRASISKTILTATADTILLNILTNELQKFLAVNLDDPDLFGENPNFTNIIAKSMLNFIDKDKIIEINSMKLFLVAQKFEIEEPMTMGWSGLIPYFNALVKELYGKAWGKAKAALMVAVWRHDCNFITILDKYLNDCQEVSSDSNVDSGSEDEIEIDNRRLDLSELINPHKVKEKVEQRELIELDMQ